MLNLMRIGFISPPVPGHFNPMSAVARQLRSRNHDIVISHAGFNTVMEALTHGVPQVAIPVTHDQPGVAARTATHQAGVVTQLEELTVFKLATLVGEVLDSSIYWDNARKLQQTIAKTNGLSRAADLLEEAFGLTKKVSE
jgi:zeaxanthin glucosyltransferase